MERCPVCKEYVFASLRHKCAPLWHVMLVGIEYDPQIRPTYARDEQEAAEKAIAKYDDGEYELIRSGEEVEVIVFDHYEQNPVRFMVEPRMEPAYYATKSRDQTFADLVTPESESEYDEE